MKPQGQWSHGGCGEAEVLLTEAAQAREGGCSSTDELLALEISLPSRTKFMRLLLKA